MNKVARSLLLCALILTACATSTDLDTGSEESPSPASTTPPPPPAETFEPPEPKAPKPIVVDGSGAVVKKVRLQADSPLVASGTHSGSSNFIVELVPRGGDSILLFNEIGSFKGEAAFDEIDSGSYRLRVEADGSWTVKLTQPLPDGDEKDLDGKFQGKGAKVIETEVFSESQPTVRATHSGSSNFIVQLIGYGDVSGGVLVFNEIGRFKGATVTDQALPSGHYLLAIFADGEWTLRFSE
jgi:hypothetical protein